MTVPPKLRLWHLAWLGCALLLVGLAALPGKEPNWDESVHARTSLSIWSGQGSVVSRLEAYEAPQAPLAFLMAGWAVPDDAGDLRGPRIVCALLGAAALALVMRMAAPMLQHEVKWPALAGGAALVGMPYFWQVSTRFYTDAPALLAIVCALAALQSGRILAAGVCLSLAIATRQFAVFAWLGTITILALGIRTSEGWRRAAAGAVPGALMCLGLLALWGGTAPKSPTAGIMPGAAWPKLSYANYYFVCLGVYAGWALLLLRSWRVLRGPALVSALLTPLFLVAVPGPNEFFASRGIAIRQLGVFDQAVIRLAGDGVGRTLSLMVCWWVGVAIFLVLVRAATRSMMCGLAVAWFSWFLLVHAMAPSHVWEKYYLLVHVPVVLGLLSTAGARSPEASAA